MPLCSATSGTSDFLAEGPPKPMIDLTKPMTISESKSIFASSATIGTAIEVSMVSHSEMYANRRRPNLSISEPISGDINKPGIDVTATTRPALADEPVTFSESHG
jgi:hypothetical protein